jgi:hypothetical protein
MIENRRILNAKKLETGIDIHRERYIAPPAQRRASSRSVPQKTNESFRNLRRFVAILFRKPTDVRLNILRPPGQRQPCHVKQVAFRLQVLACHIPSLS